MHADHFSHQRGEEIILLIKGGEAVLPLNRELKQATFLSTQTLLEVNGVVIDGE